MGEGLVVVMRCDEMGGVVAERRGCKEKLEFGRWGWDEQ